MDVRRVRQSMSDRPENGQWTVETLREYLLDKFEALQHLTAAKFESAEKLSQQALSSAEKAIAKAEGASDKRFDTTNEWRGTINDWRTSLATKSELDGTNQRLNDLVTRFERYEAASTRRETDRVEVRGQTNWGLGLAITGGLSAIAIIISVLDLVSRK